MDYPIGSVRAVFGILGSAESFIFACFTGLRLGGIRGFVFYVTRNIFNHILCIEYFSNFINST